MWLLEGKLNDLIDSMFFTNNCDGVRQNVATMFFNSITTTQIMNTQKIE